MYKEALLLRLKYSRRFQECCYLLREIWPTLKRTGKYSFAYFMLNTKDEMDNVNDNPWVRRELRKDLIKTCHMNGMEPTEKNIHLVFACVVYGVQAAITKIMTCPYTRRAFEKKPVVNPRINELVQVMSYTVIRYLRHLLEMGKTAADIDWQIDRYIENITEWLLSRGYGYYYHRLDGSEYTKQSFEVDIELGLPELFRFLDNEIKKEPKYLFPENSTARNREIRRRYIFWRWKRRGLTAREIGERWDNLNSNPGVITDEDVVRKAIRKYEDECGSLFETSPAKELIRVQKQHDAYRADAARYVWQVTTTGYFSKYMTGT